MNRTTLIAGTTAIAIALTSGMALAHGRDGGKGGFRGGPEKMLEQLDVNGDGAITMEEFKAAGEARFAKVDTDGDGLLTAEEMAAGKEARNEERQAKRIARHIERIDENGDGMVSLEEMQAASEKRAAKMFDRLDEDGDGTISAEELEAAKAKFKRGKRGDKNEESDNG